MPKTARSGQRVLRSQGDAHHEIKPAIGAEIEGTFSKKDVNGANSASYMDYLSLLDGEHSADTGRRLQRRAVAFTLTTAKLLRAGRLLFPSPVDGGMASASTSRNAKATNRPHFNLTNPTGTSLGYP